MKNQLGNRVAYLKASGSWCTLVLYKYMIGLNMSTILFKAGDYCCTSILHSQYLQVIIVLVSVCKGHFVRSITECFSIETILRGRLESLILQMLQ